MSTSALYGTDGERVAGTGPPTADAVVSAALAGGVHDGVVGSERVVAVPVASGDEVTGAVRASEPTAEVTDTNRRTWLAMAGLAVLVWARRLSRPRCWPAGSARPVRRLRDAAVRLGEGDFTVTPPLSGLAELDDAAGALAATAQHLGRLVERERAFSADRPRVTYAAHQPAPHVGDGAGAAPRRCFDRRQRGPRPTWIASRPPSPTCSPWRATYPTTGDRSPSPTSCRTPAPAGAVPSRRGPLDRHGDSRRHPGRPRVGHGPGHGDRRPRRQRAAPRPGHRGRGGAAGRPMGVSITVADEGALDGRCEQRVRPPRVRGRRARHRAGTGPVAGPRRGVPAAPGPRSRRPPPSSCSWSSRRHGAHLRLPCVNRG